MRFTTLCGWLLPDCFMAQFTILNLSMMGKAAHSAQLFKDPECCCSGRGLDPRPSDLWLNSFSQCLNQSYYYCHRHHNCYLLVSKDKSKCSCSQLTIQASASVGGKEDSTTGYEFRMLRECVQTGWVFLCISGQVAECIIFRPPFEKLGIFKIPLFPCFAFISNTMFPLSRVTFSPTHFLAYDFFSRILWTKLSWLFKSYSFRLAHQLIVYLVRSRFSKGSCLVLYLKDAWEFGIQQDDWGLISMEKRTKLTSRTLTLRQSDSLPQQHSTIFSLET